MTGNLRAHFADQIERMVTLTGELAAIESPTNDRAAVNRVAARLADEVDGLGARITTHPRNAVGDIIEACWDDGAAEAASGSPLLVVCHMDTVHPIGAIAENPVRRENGRLYGPGTYDMKGGIAATIEAVRGLLTLGRMPAAPVTLLLTTDEETGSEHSRDLIASRARESALALIMEPAMPDGSLKTSRKSTVTFTLRTFGVAAHAGGGQETGLNAIEEMADQTIALQKMTDYTVGTTVNVGIVSGGTARNTVPDRCEALIDVRATSQQEMDKLSARIMGLTPVLRGTRLEIEGGFDRPPMSRDTRMIETFQKASEIAARHGIKLQEGAAGGASDGNYTAALGTPTLDGLGPTGDGAHSEREYIIMESLAVSAAQVAALLAEWPTQAG